MGPVTLLHAQERPSTLRLPFSSRCCRAIHPQRYFVSFFVDSSYLLPRDLDLDREDDLEDLEDEREREREDLDPDLDLDLDREELYLNVVRHTLQNKKKEKGGGRLTFASFFPLALYLASLFPAFPFLFPFLVPSSFPLVLYAAVLRVLWSFVPSPLSLWPSIPFGQLFLHQ